MTTRRTVLAASLLAAYIATIPAANWAAAEYPESDVGLGLVAPGGVHFVGIALVLRDLVRKLCGRGVVLAAMGVGVVLSYWLADPRFAVASAAAFGIAETLDFFVYERLRKRGLMAAMGGSNLVGIVVDSVAFLLVAFGSLEFLSGQVLGKFYWTLAAIAVIATVERRRALAVTA
jgi:uncharacterized PurR-regulated membrane protein YhhQ (DUF165 family)